MLLVQRLSIIRKPRASNAETLHNCLFVKKKKNGYRKKKKIGFL